ncbi:T9SS type A sorting domain-containing protein [Robertkochia marina]|uniref:T9SS type A sorting domain-containing protein n=1 Tax=Robertkochia marina TaxID=1227945 RepID=A0A4V3UXW6_9FLAO|nr:T9SS type A sorting domain-containing protein [Robertkochia marina]THD66264.1 T9SS type A sorting domain-containing protein [Robertkochia marina]TRZ40902.1 T9SS C-terminal target domain-containing protein [Robertkochia marina]
MRKLLICFLFFTFYMVEAQKFRVVTLPVSYDYEFNDGFADGSGTCSSCWTYADRTPGLILSETLSEISDGYLTDLEELSVSFYEKASKDQNKPFEQIDYCQSNRYNVRDAFTGKMNSYCEARVNREDMMLRKEVPLVYGNYASTNLSNPDHNEALSYMKVWLLPNIIRENTALGYCEQLFEGKGVTISDGQWEFLGDESSEWMPLDGPFKDRYPLDVTLEELDMSTSTGLRSFQFIKLRFVIKASGSGSFHGFNTSNASSELETKGQGKAVLGPYSFTVYRCSPELTQSPQVFDVACHGDNSGSFRLSFNRELYADHSEKMIVMLYRLIGEEFEFLESQTLSALDLSEATWQWHSVLSPGTYRVRWMTKEGDDDLSSIPDIARESNVFKIGEPEPLVMQLTKKDVPCRGGAEGTITVELTGGVSPYTYSIDGEKWKEAKMFEGLKTGSYSITGRDANGCEIQGEVFLEEPETIPKAAFLLTSSPTAFEADDGFVKMFVTGGSEPYSYLWTKDGEPFSEVMDLKNLGPGEYQFFATDALGCTAETPVLKLEQPDPLKVLFFAEKDTLFCAYDKTVLRAQGTGSASEVDNSYTYLWSDGTTDPVLTSVAAGNYRVTVFDKYWNSTTSEFKITAPAVIETNTEVTHVKCYGMSDGEITLNINGGTPPYKVTWNLMEDSGFYREGQDLEGLEPGRYFYRVVDANDCEYTNANTPVEIMGPNKKLEIESVSIINLSEPGADDGSLMIEIAGGTPPYSYQWVGSDGFSAETPSIHNLKKGKYTVIVTDANAGSELIPACKIQQEFEVIAPEPLLTELSVVQPLRCHDSNDGLLEAGITGGVLPYTISWYGKFSEEVHEITNSSTVLEGVSSGVYFFEVIDANGIIAISKEVTLEVPPPLMLGTANITHASCSNARDGEIMMEITGGVPPYFITWETGENTTLHQGLSPGVYPVSVEDSNGCIITEVYRVQGENELELIVTRADDPSEYQGNDGELLFEFQDGAPPFELYANDQLVYRGSDRVYRLSELKAGTYHMELRDDSGCNSFREVILRQPPQLEIITTPPTCAESCDGAIVIMLNDPDLNPVQYAWSNGVYGPQVLNLCPGDYSVDVLMEDGQVVSIEINVSQAESYTIQVPDVVTLCTAGEALLEAGSDKVNTRYEWWYNEMLLSENRIMRVSQTGTYLLKVSSGKCVYSKSFDVIRSNTEVKPEFIMSSFGFVDEEIIAIDLTTPVPEDISWQLPANARLSDENKDGISFFFKEAGEYEIGMSVKTGGCQSTLYKKIVITDKETNSGTDQAEGDFALKVIKVYPNPTDSFFYVNLELEEPAPVSLKVFSLASNNLLSQSIGLGSTTYEKRMEMGNAPPGIYALVVEVNGRRKVYKVMKR